MTCPLSCPKLILFKTYCALATEATRTGKRNDFIVPAGETCDQAEEGSETKVAAQGQLSVCRNKAVWISTMRKRQYVQVQTKECMVTLDIDRINPTARPDADLLGMLV